jgi:hypothetical protein
VDEAFIEEYENVKKLGFEVLLYNFERKSTASIKPNDAIEIIIYRGWMIKPVEYKKMYNDLLLKNYRLINNPEEYQNCHYFPDSYEFIENYTPKLFSKKLKT